MALLYSPIKFKNLELPNRIMMSPMCMYSAKDGVPDDFHFVHYASRAQGGTGLIMVEATGVEPRGRITPQCAGIWNDEQAAVFERINRFIHEHSPGKTGIQLAHAGRKSSASPEGTQLPESGEGWQIIAPSAIPYRPEDRNPHALTIKEIAEIVSFFKSAAVRAIDAGFDVIEIHAAHGYLIHQFLSPHSNKREDEYGGSFENRTRFLIEIVDAVNAVLNQNHPLFVRISGTEYGEANDWDIENSMALAKLLQQHKVDLLDVSSGGNISGARINPGPGYQVPLAEKIKKASGIPTAAVGLITDAQQAESVLQAGSADLIVLGRELLRNPYFAVENSFAFKASCFYPPQYERAWKGYKN